MAILVATGQVTIADNNDSYVMTLSNESVVVATLEDGSGGTYGTSATSTTASIILGETNDSVNWTFSVVKQNVTCSEAVSSRTQTVTALSADTGWITFTASKLGYAPITKIFTISKAKQGISPTVYKIISSSATIAKSETGVYSPLTITFSAQSIFKTVISSYSGRYKIYRSTDGTNYSLVYTSSANEASHGYTIPASTKAVKAELYLAGGTTTLLDSQSIQVVSDGVKGDPGVNGTNGVDGDDGTVGNYLEVDSNIGPFFVKAEGTTGSMLVDWTGNGVAVITASSNETVTWSSIGLNTNLSGTGSSRTIRAILTTPYMTGDTATITATSASGIIKTVTFRKIDAVKGTYFDDTGVYTGTVIASKIIVGASWATLISPTEKLRLRTSWDTIQSRYDLMIGEANELSLQSYNEYIQTVNARTILYNYLVTAGVWSDINNSYAMDTSTDLSSKMNTLESALFALGELITYNSGVQEAVNASLAASISAGTAMDKWYLFDALQANFDPSNDYNTTLPALPVLLINGTCVTKTLNGDGTCNVSFNWQFTGTGNAYSIDGFIIYVYQSTVNSSYTFGSDLSKETYFYSNADKRSFTLLNVPISKYITFGIQSYRVVNSLVNTNKILFSSIVKPTLASENPYQTLVTVTSPTTVTMTIA